MCLLDSGMKQVVISKECKVHSSVISKLKQDKEKILNCLGVFQEVEEVTIWNNWFKVIGLQTQREKCYN